PVPILFFFNDTATTEIYTLSLHDALPIYHRLHPHVRGVLRRRGRVAGRVVRSEEHTSELQSLAYLVCRLLLEHRTCPMLRNGGRHRSVSTLFDQRFVARA